MFYNPTNSGLLELSISQDLLNVLEQNTKLKQTLTTHIQSEIIKSTPNFYTNDGREVNTLHFTRSTSEKIKALFESQGKNGSICSAYINTVNPNFFDDELVCLDNDSVFEEDIEHVGSDIDILAEQAIELGANFDNSGYVKENYFDKCVNDEYHWGSINGKACLVVVHLVEYFERNKEDEAGTGTLYSVENEQQIYMLESDLAEMSCYSEEKTFSGYELDDIDEEIDDINMTQKHYYIMLAESE